LTKTQVDFIENGVTSAMRPALTSIVYVLALYIY